MPKRKTQDRGSAAIVEEETSVVRERVANTSENPSACELRRTRLL
jgi:hypothetical protein